MERASASVEALLHSTEYADESPCGDGPFGSNLLMKAPGCSRRSRRLGRGQPQREAFHKLGPLRPEQGVVCGRVGWTPWQVSRA